MESVWETGRPKCRHWSLQCLFRRFLPVRLLPYGAVAVEACQDGVCAKVQQILCKREAKLMRPGSGSLCLLAQNPASVCFADQNVQRDRAVFAKRCMGADGNLASAVKAQQKGTFCLNSGAGCVVIEPGKKGKGA